MTFIDKNDTSQGRVIGEEVLSLTFMKETLDQINRYINFFACHFPPCTKEVGGDIMK